MIGDRKCRPLVWAAVAFVVAATGHAAHADTVILSVSDLQNIKNNLSGAYVLVKDIDASATVTWNNGAGFLPLGKDTSPFNGSFNGNGYRIINLNIKSAASSVGLFGSIGNEGSVRHLGLVGGLIVATKTASAGALAGGNKGQISDSYARVNVSGSDSSTYSAGGLVGVNWGGIFNSYASGVVKGGDSGGLVGYNYGGIYRSFATGAVSGSSSRDAGGLVATNYGQIEKSFAIGAVSGTYGRVGGLVAYNGYGWIKNCYATGAATGSGVRSGATYSVGGLVGQNDAPITAAYSIGKVTGTSSYRIGGLVGTNTGTVKYGYWDTQKSGRTTSSGGVGLTSAQLLGVLPNGFSNTVWANYPGKPYPYLFPASE